MSQEIKICTDASGSFGGGLSATDTIHSCSKVQGATIIKTGGTSSEFLKADGSVDSGAYTTCLGTVEGVTTTGDYLTGGGTSGCFNVGLNSDCAAAWDAAVAGGITGVTTSSLLSGGGNSGCVNVGVDSGALTYLDQSACAGLNCTGTVTCVNVSDGLESTGGNTPELGIAAACNTKWDQSGCAGLNCVGTVVASDISGFTSCTGDVEGVTTSTLLSGGGNSGCFNIGVDSGALTYLDQSACTGLDCEGTVQGVTTTGDYLTGGGTSGCFNVGIDSACANKWNNAASGGVQSLATSGGIVDAGSATDPSICIDAACNTKWDQSGCSGINKVGTVTGSTAGALLSTNNNSACTQFGINAGALDYLNQSACPGIDCVGTVVPADIVGFTECTGTVVASDIANFTCCLGTVTGVAGTAGVESSGGTSPTLCIASSCNTKWNTGATTASTLATCTGLNCLGDITEVTTNGDYLTGGGTTGAINIGLEAACAIKWDNASAGGVTNVTGSDGVVSSGGLTPNLCIDSSCNTKWDQSGCAGLNCTGTVVATDIENFTCCLGDVTGIDAGTAITISDGTTATPEVAVTAACNTAWNSAKSIADGLTSCAGLGCTGTVVAGDLTGLDQSACPGIDCIGTVVAGDISGFTGCLGTTTPSNTQTFTNKSGNISQWTNDSNYTDCNGTVTGSTAGPLLSTNNNSQCIQFGINAGALAPYDQSTCPGIDCVGTVVPADIVGFTECTGTVVASDIADFTCCLGTVTGVSGTAGIVSSGGTAPIVCIDGACNTKWNNKTTCIGTVVASDLTGLDQSACPGIDCVGDITSISGVAGLSGSALAGAATIGIDSGTLTPFDQSGCAGLLCTGTVTSVAGTNGIESTGGASPTLCITTSCQTKFDQSTCPGIDCVGTVVAADIVGFTECTGTVVASDIEDFTCCLGTVTGVSGTAGIVSSGGTAPIVCIDGACNTKWNNKTTCTGTITTAGALLSGDATTLGVNSGALNYLNQSACPGIDCTGTVVAGDISGFTGCLGTTTPSNTQTFTNKSGNISQWTNDSNYTTCTGDVKTDATNQSIAGVKTFTGQLKVDDDGGTGVGLEILGGGNGGPLLRVERDEGGTGIIEMHSFGSDPTITMASQQGTGNTFSLGVLDDDFQIADAGSLGSNSRFHIKSDGKIGMGTSSPSEALTVTGNISATGGFLSGGVNIDQLFGTGGGGGTVTNVQGDASITVNNGSTDACLSISTSCVTKFDQSGCAGLNCTGTLVDAPENGSHYGRCDDSWVVLDGALCTGTVGGTGTNNYIAAWSSSTGLTDSKLRQTFTDVIAGATLSATGGLETDGQILSAGQELHALLGGGGGGGSVDSVTAGDTNITIGGTASNPTVAVTAGCFGNGTVTSINGADSSISIASGTTDACVSIATACQTAWNGTYTTVQSNSATWAPPALFNVVDDGTTGKLTTNSFADIDTIWDTPAVLDSSGYSWNGSTGALTVLKAGTLQITLKVVTWNNLNNRHQLVIRINKNGTFMTGDSQYASRNNTQDEGGAYIPMFMMPVAANDVITFQAKDIGVAATMGGSTQVSKMTYVSAVLYPS